jgi:NAD(P)-dependent dehydrogenase (short-subunit alcohol dehydrogenase family)
MDVSKPILVTGASSGIGRCITERLAALGHVVYAGARRPADLHALERIANVRPLRLDVTRQDDIDAALARVEHDGRGLYGLINNAGVGSIGSVADGDMDDFELVMNVNAHAPVRVTRAFIPLIAAAKGRIVIMGSVAGILADKDLCAYSMSKHAIEALADGLADEMNARGVSVSLIEPGPCRTRLIHNAAQRLGPDPRFLDLSAYDEPDAVAVAVERALFETTPKRRYLIVSAEAHARLTLEKHIEQLAQLNQASSHAFERAALIEMLDTMLARYTPDRR